MSAPSTDTPRTDAHFFSTGSEMKTLEFCRSMERDLAAALARHANETSTALVYVGKLERLRDELIAMNDRLKIEREQAIAKADAATRIMNEADKKRADAEKRLESINREPMSREAFAEVQRVNRMHRALHWLLSYHPESPETGAELPREHWTPDYRAAVDYAKEALK